MSNVKYACACGVYCDECSMLGKRCKGCGNVKGKPFWTVEYPNGICPIYNCCCNEKSLEHCGFCNDFPCKIFTELRDPDMSNEEFEKSLIIRKKVLKTRAEI